MTGGPSAPLVSSMLTSKNFTCDRHCCGDVGLGAALHDMTSGAGITSTLLIQLTLPPSEHLPERTQCTELAFSQRVSPASSKFAVTSQESIVAMRTDSSAGRRTYSFPTVFTWCRTVQGRWVGTGAGGYLRLLLRRSGSWRSWTCARCSVRCYSRDRGS